MVKDLKAFTKLQNTLIFRKTVFVVDFLINHRVIKLLKKFDHGYQAIIANGKYYDSIIASVKAGEAKDRFQALRFFKK
jgi:hypothetical protein